ncbi:MAG: AraC family transcriptional regulator, partial [Clostridia bacterium]|nr:AraC family transcriptional regulator [Clostridia bacterium]
LQTTDLSLEEISERCGFTNLLTFRRNFKATMGINPSDYRKQ